MQEKPQYRISPISIIIIILSFLIMAAVGYYFYIQRDNLSSSNPSVSISDIIRPNKSKALCVPDISNNSDTTVAEFTAYNLKDLKEGQKIGDITITQLNTLKSLTEKNIELTGVFNISGIYQLTQILSGDNADTYKMDITPSEHSMPFISNKGEAGCKTSLTVDTLKEMYLIDNSDFDYKKFITQHNAIIKNKGQTPSKYDNTNTIISLQADTITIMYTDTTAETYIKPTVYKDFLLPQ